MYQVAVNVATGELMRRDRRSAARIPFRRPASLIELSPIVDRPEKLPDVFDVAVGKCIIVATLVYPLAEPSLSLSADHSMTALHFWVKASSPYSSISLSELKPSSLSTPISIQSPWQSKPF